MLEILNARADLSRRALIFTLQGLSFREYLNITQGYRFTPWTLDGVIRSHIPIAQEILPHLRPLVFFSDYLKTGYYPFFLEGPNFYAHKLIETINLIIEIELPTLRKVDPLFTSKVKKLLGVIAESSPFVPNVTKLSERIGINRHTLISYLGFLKEARLLINLYKESQGLTSLQKPDKIYLENTNLGNVRETFLVNQLSKGHRINHTDQGDFLVEDHITIEMGGKNKTRKQLQNIEESYIAADDIEVGWGHKIPLWLFGFLY